MHFRFLPVSLLFLITPALHAQKSKKTDKVIIASLEAHIHYLADDKLEGRRAGDAGEKLAASYISEAFQKAGLEPGAQHGWLQPFGINDGKEVSDATHLTINGRELKEGTEFFPLAFSGSRNVQGSPAIALQESGVPWFMDLKEMLDTNQHNPHFDLEAALHEKAKEFAAQGATAIVFYNTSSIDDHLAFNPKDNTETASIPVLYISREAKNDYLKDESASIDMQIKIDIREKKRTGNNVLGYLDNGASDIVIIGAHYDHLGYGEVGNSLYRGKEKMIHHGADDNASGTAALIELAKMLKQSKDKKNNYLFIAFSGEELGLFGSKYFVEHPTVDLKKVNYMINMDMVGRLNDSSHVLTVGGFGTSPAWAETTNIKESKKYITVKYDSSGTGPSDHTSFYRKDIPVLFFFTGIHSDYHKPSDEYNKINYTGELQVLKYIYDVIDNLNEKGKIAFLKTRETQSTSASARFSVTLGIMPDYTYSGSGVRVDGISDGRPAQKAGLLTGDVIVQLGGYPVSSLENYMEALSKFKKGDETRVKYKRGNDMAEAPVKF